MAATSPISRLFASLSALSICCIILPSLVAQDDTWSGNASNTWNNSGNWISGNIPTSGDTATFDNAGSGNTTIDLTGGVTLNRLLFDTSSAASYIIGVGGAGVQTLILDPNSLGIDVAASVTMNQIINAIVEVNTGTILFNNDSTTASIEYAGGFDDAGTNTGVRTIAFDGVGTTLISGDIRNTGSADRLDVQIRNGNVTLSGAIQDGVLTMRSNPAKLTVTSTGSVSANRNLNIERGEIEFQGDVTRTTNTFLGHGTGGNSDATLTLGGNLYWNGGEIRRYDDNDTASKAFITGGNIVLNNWRYFRNDKNTVATIGPELTISSNILLDGTNRGVVFRGNGTTRVDSAIISPELNFTVESGMVQLGTSGALNSLVRNLSITALDGTGTWDDGTLDLMGTNQTMSTLVLGNVGTLLGGGGKSSSLIDSVGGGILSLDGDVQHRNGTTLRVDYGSEVESFANNQYVTSSSGGRAWLEKRYDNGATGNLTFRDVTGTWNIGDTITGTTGTGNATATSGVIVENLQNAASTVSAHIHFINANRVIYAEDNGNSDVDLTISGNITSDTSIRTVHKRWSGTALLSGNTLSFGHLTVENGGVLLQQNNAFTSNVANFSLQGLDAAFTQDFASPFLDLNGATATINALNLGNAATLRLGSTVDPINGSINNAISGATSTLDDTAGGGLLRFDNNINVRGGTTQVIQIDNRTLDFQGGQYLLGNTSGALALIDRNYNAAGVTGNVSIHMVSGTFQDGELLKQVNNSLVEAGRTANAVGSNMTTQALGLGDIRNGQAIINADIEIIDNGTNQGGTSFVVEEGKDAIDLVVNGDISDDATPGDASKQFRDLTLQDAGVVQLNGNNTHDRTFIANRKLIAGSGDIFGTGNGTRDNGDGDGRVFIRQNNTGTRWIWDGAPTLDVNGQNLILKENLIIGDWSTNNVSQMDHILIEDSAGGGLLIFSANNANLRNDLTYAGGTGYVERVSPGNQRMATISSDIRIDHHTSWSIQDGADDVDLVVSGSVYDNTGTWNLNKFNPGTLKLTGTQSNYNQLLVYEGRVIVDNPGAFGDNLVRLGGASMTSGQNDVDGTLEIQSPGNFVWGLSFQIGEYTNTANSVVGDTGSGIILNNGAGVATFTDEYFINQNANVLADRTLTLGGNNTGRNTIFGAVRDVSTHVSSPTLGLTKTGSGSWFLVGNNSYSGDTDVQEGRLDLYGTSLPGSLTVAANASFGGDAQIGGNATFGGNNTLFVDATTPEAFTVAGDSSFTGGANITVSLEGKGGDVNGNIIVYDYAGTLGSNGSLTFADFNSAVTGDTATSARGGSATLQDDGDKLFVNLGYATRTWNGNSGNTTWNEGALGDANWVEGDMLFYNGDTVVFDDANSGAGGNVTRTVNVAVPVSPNKIDVQADTVDFTFSGSEITIEDQLVISGNSNVRFNNVISGNGMVVKGNGDDGTRDFHGVLILAGNNTYTGGTLIQERNIQITNNNALGTGLVTLSDDNQGSGGSGDNQDPVLQLTGSATNVANDFYFTNGGGSKTIQSISNSLKVLTGTLTTDEQGNYETRLDPNTTSRAIDYQGKITGIGGLHNVGLGNVTLSNASNDFKGWLTTYRGNTNVASIKDAGVASHAGAGNKIQLGMRNLTGTLTYTGTGDSTNRQVQIGDYWFDGGAPNWAGGGVIRNNGSGALNFTNSTFNIQDSDTAARLGARTLTLGGSYDGSSGNNQIGGAILNNNVTNASTGSEFISIAVEGSNWELNGDNTYSGTTVATGNSTSLFINGDSSGAIGDVTIGTGTDTPTFGGSGTVGGNTTIRTGATHTAATKSTAGTQTFSNDLSYETGTTVTWNLVSNSTSAGEFDQFSVGGSLAFGTTMTNDLTLDINFGSGVNIDDTFWNNGAGVNEWEIWDYNTLSSTFGDTDFVISLSGDSTGSGLSFFQSGAFEIANSNFANDNTGIWLRQVAPIPEPGTYALMGLGLGAFAWFARRRKKRA